MTVRYTSNPDLPTIKADWAGTPITDKNRYINHEHPYIPNLKDIWKWKRKVNPDTAKKQADKWRLQTKVIEDLSALPDPSITWLGHATFIIKVGGYTILTDPVYKSPTWLMPRYSTLPIAPEAVTDVDVLLISHDHRDHVDGSSLKHLLKRNKHTDIYTGLGMTKLLSSYSTGQRIIEAGWYQRYPHPDLEITYLPTRHWSKRSLTDTNRRLWGSFMIKSRQHTVYFGGDSGYGSHYAETRATLGTVDVAILGIGAYKPEWFMHASHTSPIDAYKAATDLGAKTMIPMHYGTFDLSDEAISDPYYQVLDIDRSAVQPLVAAIQPGQPLRL